MPYVRVVVISILRNELCYYDSLAPGKYEWNFKQVSFQANLSKFPKAEIYKMTFNWISYIFLYSYTINWVWLNDALGVPSQHWFK